MNVYYTVPNTMCTKMSCGFDVSTMGFYDIINQTHNSNVLSISKACGYDNKLSS